MLFFWREYTYERPDWAKPRSRVLLTQAERVVLRRNLSWRAALDTILEPIPKGQKFYLTALPERAPLPTIAAPAQQAKKVVAKKLATPALAPAAKKVAPKRKQPVVNESDEASSEDYSRPKKRRRVLTSPEEEKKYGELLVDTHGESDISIVKWLKTNYSMYAKSITVTGKQQALRTLAALLTQE